MIVLLFLTIEPRKQLETKHQGEDIVSTLHCKTLDDFAERTVPRLMDKSGATGGSILLVNSETLMVHAARGLKESRGHNARIPMGVGVTGEAARSGETQWVPDVGQRDNYIEGVADAEWELAIPVGDDHETSLVIDLESDQEERPDEQTRDEIVRYLTVRRDPLINLAEKARYRRLSRTDTLSSLLDSDSFVQAIKGRAPGGLFVMDLEPRLDTGVVSAFGELKTTLRTIGEQLAGLFDEDAVLTRFYGTTFGVFVPDLAPGSIDTARTTIQRELADTCSVKHSNSRYVEKSSDVQALVDEVFINQQYSDNEQADRQLELGQILRDGCIDLHYQPVQHVRFKRSVGHEILVRGPENSPLRSPKDLFRTAYDGERIDELDRLITRTALSEYPAGSDRTLFLNVERTSLNSKKWRTTLLDGVGALPDTATVCIEITEHDSLSDLHEPIETLRDKLGSSVLFAIDDFGTGSSNFRSVLELSPDVVKLDRSLISHIDEGFEKRSLVESVLTFSTQTDIDVVAEGVERKEEWEVVRELGAELAQGYYFARPEPLQQLVSDTTNDPIGEAAEAEQ